MSTEFALHTASFQMPNGCLLQSQKENIMKDVVAKTIDRLISATLVCIKPQFITSSQLTHEIKNPDGSSRHLRSKNENRIWKCLLEFGPTQFLNPPSIV